ncbi:G2E3 ligase, partial [Xiphorhynchus elegans]|nr:G2E3 ligase [Xiphorhynchus elegans]
DTQCLMCMEPVEDRTTFMTLVCPECKNAWFHRDCIQGQALCAGILSLQCPLCRNDREFMVDMFAMGIRIPFRLPTWEENDAFIELGQRHGHCDARECLCPAGREEAEAEG